ncbi:MAG: SGNH/GDSL hydrolase family protein [Scytonema sp. PMC 1069.18]|nr:SGNH/GDSL hydrolase family protein [Scytonema sp. PMC 1069.18]MEC4884834.1 SGNH/GDSL hydrolase family protein [Scytonema sp. PMC 1070.18]
MKKELIAAGFVISSLLSPLKALAADFSQFFVFDNSLSDTGNVFNATQSLPSGPIPPSPPYFQGRFSNGRIWVDYVGEEIGLTPTLFTNLSNTIPTQGINFAFGGANSGNSNAFVPGAPGILTQIDFFTQTLQASNQKADPNALYAIWGGANDYLFSQNPNVDQTIENVSNAIRTLNQTGAKNILVFNLPDLGKIPLVLGSENSQNLTTLTNIHNTALMKALGQFSSIPGINIIPVDINSLFDKVLANPEEFGFKYTDTSCIVYKIEINQVLRTCDNPNDYLFFDEVHPTTNAHKLVAQTALTAIKAKSVPESSLVLSMLIFGALGVGKILKLKRKQAT